MRIWFPDWAYLDLVFSLAYNSISIIHYSKLMSLTSRMVARICSHFQLSSPITHQNEWRVSEKEKKKKNNNNDGVSRVIEIEWLWHFCNSTQQLEPTVSVLSHHCQPLHLHIIYWCFWTQKIRGSHIKLKVWVFRKKTLLDLWAK